MIKNKDNIIELLNEIKGFTYFKEDLEIDVILKASDSINIRYYNDKYIIMNFFDYKDAISKLYKDRKYINRRLSQ